MQGQRVGGRGDNSGSTPNPSDGVYTVAVPAVVGGGGYVGSLDKVQRVSKKLFKRSELAMVGQSEGNAAGFVTCHFKVGVSKSATAVLYCMIVAACVVVVVVIVVVVVVADVCLLCNYDDTTNFLSLLLNPVELGVTRWVICDLGTGYIYCTDVWLCLCRAVSLLVYNEAKSHHVVLLPLSSITMDRIG